MREDRSLESHLNENSTANHSYTGGMAQCYCVFSFLFGANTPQKQDNPNFRGQTGSCDGGSLPQTYGFVYIAPGDPGPIVNSHFCGSFIVGPIGKSQKHPSGAHLRNPLRSRD